jgi:biopolymer transport protein TolR
MSTTRRKRRKLMGDINMIPMIDVMLVLLIVFMVTAPLITQGIKVDLPQADAEPIQEDEEATLVVSINAEGEYFISLGVTDPENPEPVPLELIGENVAKILEANPAVPVFLEADDTITYGVVASLLSTLGRAGAEGVQLITQPPGPEN